MGCSTRCLFRVPPPWPEPRRRCQPRCGVWPVPDPCHAHFLTCWQLPVGHGLSGWQRWVHPPPQPQQLSQCFGKCQHTLPSPYLSALPLSCQVLGVCSCSHIRVHHWDCPSRGCALSWRPHPWHSTHPPPPQWSLRVLGAGPVPGGFPGTAAQGDVSPGHRDVPARSARVYKNRWWNL